VAVEATLTIPRVDLNSGNVYFEGRIVVTGDVIAGMKVRSDSEVIIHGVVEAAEIEAKGDIVVKGGVIGNLEISNVPAPSSGSMPPVSAARPSGGSQYRLPAITASTASGSGRPGSIPPPATGRSKSVPPPARTSSHPSIPAISARSPSVMIAAIVGRGSATSRSSLMPAVSGSAPPPSKGARMPAVLRSGGSVVAKFVESAVVDARRRITVAEHVKQSELTALDRVDIGTSPGRGRLVGGIVRASARVQVQIAGTSNEVPTTIEVGTALVSAVLERTRVELEQVETEHGLIVRMITRSRSVAGGMNADDHERRRADLARRMADLAAERDALEGQLRMSTEPEVVVRDRLHAGVTIKIGDRTTTVTDERGAVRVRLVEGELDF
jgi:uncharacterized protein (DUF342 family)